MQLTDDDKELLRRANAVYANAQAVVNFVGNYLTDKYQLPPDARILQTGAIELSKTDGREVLSD